METHIKETSTIVEDTYIGGSGLEMGLWTPFQPSKVIDLRIFTYDNKIGIIV